jgi:hypothetical protein
VNYALEAIAYVLRGNLGSAKATIKQSKKDLPDSVSSLSASASSSSSSEELGSDLEIPLYQVVSHNRYPFGRQYSEGESSVNRSTRVTNYAKAQISIIRKWLYSMLWSRIDRNNEWILKVRTCVSEIAHALIYSLPDKYLPSEESKFIGRYPVEENEVIGNRIEPIVQHITEMDNDGDLVLAAPEVVVVGDILRAIRGILMRRWDGAKAVIRKSMGEYVMEGNHSRLPFHRYIDGTYGLWIPLKLPILPELGYLSSLQESDQ